MRKVSLVAGALGLASAGIALAQGTAVDNEAAAFGARESAAGVDLSPDGRKVVYLAPAPAGGSVAFIADVATGSTKAFLNSGNGKERLSWCNFVTNERLICRYTAIVDDAGTLLGFSRLIAINGDGSGMKQLGQNASFYDESIRQFDGSIIDWMPGQGGSILMAKSFIPEAGRTGSRMVRSKEGLGVDRIDTLSLKSSAVEPAQRSASGYMTDGLGTVRMMATAESNGQMLTGRTKYSYRTKGSRSWSDLTSYVTDEEFVPLAIDATIDALYALKPLNGRQALYRIKLTSPISSELVASNPRVDIDQVVRSANGQRVIGYSYAEDKRQVTYFDPEYASLSASLRRATKLPIVNFGGTSQDGTKVLIFAGSDSDPGRYYLFDKTKKGLNELFLARPELENHPLATVKPVMVRAADGTAIPSYLTLPAGKEAKNLPGVVLPHGGPSARDEWGFDWLAQYLAAKGYAVLQPNYRGSAGFGDAWLMENGFKNWRTSIGDITSSAKWLSDQGIVDPKRTAIVGWSYGGYAALQAAATEPGLFKAVAAIAPVTDLAMLKTEAEKYTNADIVAEFVGSGPHIRDGSPLQHAAAIKVPVLLVHGDMDQNVGVNESVRMAGALRSAGTPVEFLRYPSLDHQLEDSRARREMLTKIGALLDRTIGH